MIKKIIFLIIILFSCNIVYSSDYSEWKLLKNKLVGIIGSCCFNEKQNTVILFMENGKCIMLKGKGKKEKNEILYKEITCPI